MIQFERWSLLVIGVALRSGATRFSEFRDEIDISPTTLIGRLEGLVASGLMSYHAGSGPRDGEYTLTDKGKDSGRRDHGARRVERPMGAGGADARGPHARRSRRNRERRHVNIARADAALDARRVRALGRGRARAGLSVGSQRLLVFLALHDREVTRSAVAGTMWPEVSEVRAGISLRSALTRLDPATRDAILIASAGLSLESAVEVDFHDAQLMARRLVEGRPEPDDVSLAAIGTLSQELLPDWYDDWVVAEAEDWRQLRVNALETLAGLLVDDDRLGEAAGAARAAIRVDPLRESAYAALIAVHVAKGNQSEALKVFDRYADLLSTALDLQPTDHLRELIAPIRE